MGYELRINHAAVLQPLSGRVLEAMAHLVVHVVSRLRLYSVGRNRVKRFPALCQPADHLCNQRALAWRQLDLRRLGPFARHLPDRVPATARFTARFDRLVLVKTVFTFSLGDLRLDIFSR